MEEKCDNLPECQTEGGCTKMESLSPQLQPQPAQVMLGQCMACPKLPPGSSLSQVVWLERSVKAA